MASYAIGDLQGCYQELLDLLELIQFDDRHDRLLLVGDLVNRGPNSLAVLRFLKELKDDTIIVLGNHDLHLLATAGQPQKKHPKDTLDEIINAPDKDELLDWLRHKPLLHDDKETGYLLLHAGIPPQWDKVYSLELAAEIHAQLSQDDYTQLFQNMYGKEPLSWSEELSRFERNRYIINCFTRIRYCDSNGRLSLTEKTPPTIQLPNIQPWFTWTHRKTKTSPIIFGHWSTVYLGEITNFSEYQVYPLDTGCLWGGKLTALRLEDKQWFSVPSRQSNQHTI